MKSTHTDQPRTLPSDKKNTIKDRLQKGEAANVGGTIPADKLSLKNKIIDTTFCVVKGRASLELTNTAPGKEVYTLKFNYFAEKPVKIAIYVKAFEWFDVIHNLTTK